MNQRYDLNNQWQFTENYTPELLDANYDGPLEEVRLPHTNRELPYHYFSEKEYQMVCGYRKFLEVPTEWTNKKILLTFHGAAHDATVYINGKEAGSHHSGYTAFTLDISDLVVYGEQNLITVRLDSQESLNVPPFGFVIDYLTYGGLYREVSLEVKEPTYISDIFVQPKVEQFFTATKGYGTLTSEISITGDTTGMMLRQFIAPHGEEKSMLLGECSAGKPLLTWKVGTVGLWNTETPALYDITTELVKEDEVVERQTHTVGFRTMEFREDGFYLNEQKIRIRGLNRHQSYAYVGYAMPASMQKLDADILKKELGCNATRTSHYPQSHHFIQRCDELGLLVFMEFPGWQHIGNEAWKEQAVTNLKEMIVQYRNHPSIMIWGVRINESVDDEAFYQRTNKVAHLLDPTRQTGGVRCYKKGDFQEDVFTYNDFVHRGYNRGCEKKSNVTPNTKKPYLVTEYNGHMYPTKAYDWEEHRLEHALRHANVLNDVAETAGLSGSFGWCMFDYNTHKDFGSGDRICYHGVMDMFRNPKLAANVYAAQQEETPVLAVSSTMDIGEHPGSNRGDVYIFTNAKKVRMYRGDTFIKEFDGTQSTHPNLAHGPILVDDYIGSMLETREHMPHKQAEELKALLNQVARYGLYDIPKSTYLKMAKLLVRYRMKRDDAVNLYQRYIGDWGGESTQYIFQAMDGDKVLKTVTCAPMNKKILSVYVDHQDLSEGATYDVAAIRVCLTDEFGNVLPFANDPITFQTEGDIQLIGPSLASLQGGMGGTYVKTTKASGSGKLTITALGADPVTVDFTIGKEVSE